MRARVLVGGGVLAVLLATGCPRPRCAYVDGANGPHGANRCVPLVCPHGSTADGDGRCACVDGLVPMFGACMPVDRVQRFCGPSTRVEPTGACVRRACEPDAAVDWSTGACVPSRTLRDIASSTLGLRLQDEQRLGCPGAVMGVRGSSVFCLAPQDACTRTEGRTAKGCDAAPPCPPGEVRDEAASRCERVVLPRRGTEYVVDVATWARLALGPDGGTATPAVCAPLRADARALTGGAMGSSRVLALDVTLVFPDNDVTQVETRVRTHEGGYGKPAGPASGRVAAAVGDVVEALRDVGGVASAAAVDLRVRCDVQMGQSPAGVARGAGDAGVDGG